eukprot:Sspe_Gene.16593::Locus_5857_Transcript_1_1_Confidence_1.000_Length_3468::g.16593::m.16593/K04739/PRKAR; cAMP-dependent protein kinase regulator
MGCGASSPSGKEKKKKKEERPKERRQRDAPMQGLGPGNGQIQSEPASADGSRKGHGAATAGGEEGKHGQMTTIDKVKRVANDDPFSETSSKQDGNPSPTSLGAPTPQSDEFDLPAQDYAQPKKKVPAFVFGDPAADGSGTSKSRHLSVEEKERKSSSRRRGVSQDVLSAEDANWEPPKHTRNTPEQAQRIRDSVVNNPLFSALRTEDFEIIVGAMEEEQFEPNTYILRQDEESSQKYYVIHEGSVEVVKDGKIVATFTPGSCFGELELMYNTLCVASVRTVTAATCFSLDRSTYRHIIMKVSKERQRVYKELLSGVTFLSGLNDHQKMVLADAVEPCTFAAGEVIIHFGTNGEWMHIIHTGTVEVIGRDANDASKEVSVCELGPGSTIGEIEFLNRHKCVADVVARTDVRTCRLHRDHFEKCMGPVKDYLTNTVEKHGDYNYYRNNTTTVDGQVLFIPGFSFGDQDTDASPPTPSSSRTPMSASLSHKGGRIVRREAVSATPLDSNFVPPKHPKSDEERQLLRKVVESHSLLGVLHEKDREVIIDAMERISFGEGTTILAEGEEGDGNFHIITEGHVQVSREGKTLCTFGPGSGFGELELLYDQPLRATVVATEDLTTWALDRETYKHIVIKGTSERRHWLKDVLRGVKVFERCDEDRITMLADALAEETYNPGDKLLVKGESPEWMHVVLMGEVEVVGKGGQTVCTFGTGGVVGELEFLNGHPTVADVVAVGEVLTGKLHRSHFERVLGPITQFLEENSKGSEYEYYRKQLDAFSFGAPALLSPKGRSPSSAPLPPIVKKRVAVSAEVVDPTSDFVPKVFPKSAEENQMLQDILGRNILFRALQGDRKGMDIVVNAMEKATFHVGDEIMREDEVGGERWYVVAEGEVEIIKKGSVVACFGPGDSFGEMELMYSCRTAATVRAKTELVCYSIDRETYQHIILKASMAKREHCKAALENVQFLKHMTQWEQDNLADALEPCSYREGETIITMGEEPEAMHIIVEGKAVVVGREDDGETLKEVCVLSHGDMLGDLEFLNQHKAVADVKAATECSTFKLHRDHFEACLGPIKGYIAEKSIGASYSYYQDIVNRATQ